MYQLIVSFTINKNTVWQIPLDVSNKCAFRLSEAGYLAVVKAAECELMKQLEEQNKPEEEQHAKSNQKTKKKK